MGALASIVLSAKDVPEACKVANLDGSVQVVVCYLQQVTNASPLLAIAFWVAGTGALFSTADAQIYSFFSIQRFDVREGKIAHAEFKELRPAFYAAIAAALFAGCYALVRFLTVDFDQLVFVLMPSCLNIVPALILAVRGTRQEPILLWISIVPYAVLRFSRSPEYRRSTCLCRSGPVDASDSFCSRAGVQAEGGRSCESVKQFRDPKQVRDLKRRHTGSIPDRNF